MDMTGNTAPAPATLDAEGCLRLVRRIERMRVKCQREAVDGKVDARMVDRRLEELARDIASGVLCDG